MSERRATRRYVQGFLQVVQQQGLIDQVEQALHLFDTQLTQNKDVKTFLYHPTISRERKKSLLRKVLGDTVPGILKSFLDYVIEKKRERILESLYAEFKDAADALRGIVRAKVTSAVELTAGQSSRLQAELEKLLQKKVVFEFQRDQSLIGGMQVMVGTHIFDGTVTGRLQTLHKHLLDQVGNLRTGT